MRGPAGCNTGIGPRIHRGRSPSPY